MAEPQTATAIAMLNSEGQRLEMRDRRVAMAVAAKVVAEHFRPEEIEDMRDARAQIITAAEFAAYEAIQKERELHTHDMAALKAFADVKWADAMLKRHPAIAIEAGTDATVKQGAAEGESAGP
jgi:hypothetical protein